MTWGSLSRSRGPVVLVDHAAEHLAALHRRVNLDSRSGNPVEVGWSAGGADQGERHQISIMTTADRNAAVGELPEYGQEAPGHGRGLLRSSEFHFSDLYRCVQPDSLKSEHLPWS